ncbi:MAG: alpha/beta hydrolase [Rhodospirillaceae bacterium]|nr:alpha/beta hydrolase [Rhodospirillaceae bacterium]
MAGPGSYEQKTYTSPDGLKLAVRDYPGPANPRLTIVCIPGLTRNARDFDELAPHLAQKYRVLSVDLRGRGLSEYAKDFNTYQPPVYVRDVAALLDAFSLKHVALIGTSLGGIISVVLGAVIPRRVLGIVMNDIGPEVDTTGLTRIAAYVARGYTGASWDEAAAALKAVDGKIYPDYTHADWLKMARRRFIEAPDGKIKNDYDLNIAKPFGNAAEAGSAATSLWPFFLQLKDMPLLAMRGAISDVLSPETFARMKERLPHMQQCLVPDRGHTPYYDEPVALNAVDDFLARLPDRLSAGESLKRGLRQIAFLIRLKLGALPGTS